MDLLVKIEEREKERISKSGIAPEYLVMDVYSYSHLCATLAKDEVQYYNGLKVAVLVDEGQTEIDLR